jgi:hypothetical protein
LRKRQDIPDDHEMKKRSSISGKTTLFSTLIEYLTTTDSSGSRYLDYVCSLETNVTHCSITLDVTEEGRRFKER